MPKKPLTTCPAPDDFLKWWRRRANLNADELKAEGKPMRVSNYTVTEDQVNRRYHLAPKNFKPGQVLEKLKECNIPAVDVKPGEFQLAWNPKQFSK